jgi:hypothetical protein
MDANELPDNVLSAVIQNLGYSNDDDFWGDDKLVNKAVKQIAKMTSYEVINRFLEWHGIIGYTQMIITAIETVKKIEKEM